MCSLLSRTQLGKLSEPHDQTWRVYDTPASTYDTPASTYKDVITIKGGAGDHTHTPAMELSQCPAYITNEVSGRGIRGDVGEESIYDN